MSVEIGVLPMNGNANLAAAGARHSCQVSLLPAFDEIAKTFLTESHGKVHPSLQRYLDGRVAVGGAYCTRRAILLAIHDMKEDLEAPPALQQKALAELRSLEVRPAPQVRFYRDIATVFLRMEVILRSRATQPQ